MKVVARGTLCTVGRIRIINWNPNHQKIVQDSIPQIYHSLTGLGRGPSTAASSTAASSTAASSTAALSTAASSTAASSTAASSTAISSTLGFVYQ